MNPRFSEVRRGTRWIVKESSVYFSIFRLTSTPGFYEKRGIHTYVYRGKITHMMWKNVLKRTL